MNECVDKLITLANDYGAEGEFLEAFRKNKCKIDGDNVVRVYKKDGKTVKEDVPNNKLKVFFIEHLIEKLNLANVNYYNSLDTGVYYTDTEYNDRYELLVCLLEEYGDSVRKIFPNSPTIQVGGVFKGSKEKHVHARKMLSIKNSLKEEDLDKFFAQKVVASAFDFNKTSLLDSGSSVVISPKVDGVACSIWYNEGKFWYATTRGDGTTGEDITEHVRHIKNVPKTLVGQWKGTNFEVRGEVYITREDFDAANKKAEMECAQKNKKFTPFQNPRNLVAGTLNGDKLYLCNERNLMFVAHSSCRDGLLSDELEMYKNCGFEVVDYIVINTKTKRLQFDESTGHSKPIDVYKKAIKSMWDDVVSKLPYNCDGIVLAVNDSYVRSWFPENEKYAQGLIACKYLFSIKGNTKLNKIEYTVGKTGKITPIAVFDEINLDGCRISKASLGSKEVLESLDLYEGDTIQISKAGGIVPHVDCAIPELRVSDKKYSFPTKCPKCGGDLSVQGKKTFICVSCAESNERSKNE